MNLYLLKQNDNDGYDTYDSCVVCASSEDEAQKIHPDERSERTIIDAEDLWWEVEEDFRTRNWANKLENVKVALIGVAKEGLKKGVVCASYNAG